MGVNDWAKAYQVGRTNVDYPHGATKRPFPGGQKIGANLPMLNAPFSAQAQSKVVQIADYNSGLVGSDPRTGDVIVDIASPSRRVALGLQLFFEWGDINGTVLPIPGASPLTSELLEVGINPLSGSRTPMAVIASKTGPASYEVDPVYRGVRLIVHVSSFNLDYTAMGIETARLMLGINWEPNVLMAPDELARLYALTEITIPQTISL